MKGLKQFEAEHDGRKVKVAAISATKAIFTGAKILHVKPNKVSVRQIERKNENAR